MIRRLIVYQNGSQQCLPIASSRTKTWIWTKKAIFIMQTLINAIYLIIYLIWMTCNTHQNYTSYFINKIIYDKNRTQNVFWKLSESEVMSIGWTSGKHKRKRWQGLISISNKTSHCKISQNLEATKFVLRIIRSHWNFTVTPAALLLKDVSNIKALRWFKILNDQSRGFETLRDLTIKGLIGFRNGVRVAR